VGSGVPPRFGAVVRSRCSVRLNPAHAPTCQRQRPRAENRVPAPIAESARVGRSGRDLRQQLAETAPRRTAGRNGARIDGSVGWERPVGRAHRERANARSGARVASWPLPNGEAAAHASSSNEMPIGARLAAAVTDVRCCPSVSSWPGFCRPRTGTTRFALAGRRSKQRFRER
jgi:hypothetical protein